MWFSVSFMLVALFVSYFWLKDRISITAFVLFLYSLVLIFFASYIFSYKRFGVVRLLILFTEFLIFASLQLATYSVQFCYSRNSILFWICFYGSDWGGSIQFRRTRITSSGASELLNRLCFSELRTISLYGLSSKFALFHVVCLFCGQFHYKKLVLTEFCLISWLFQSNKSRRHGSFTLLLPL